LLNRNEKYGGLKDNHLILDKQKDNQLCDELKKEEMIKSRQGFIPNAESQGRFQVDVKTGRLKFFLSILLLI
jgi:hypothetical protein